jgi:hypothetical protein
MGEPGEVSRRCCRSGAMVCIRTRSLLAMLAVFVAVHGCAPSPEFLVASTAEWSRLPPELQKIADEQLVAHGGTFAGPKLLGAAGTDEEWLKRGQAVYQLRCVQCHGDNGDGNGPVHRTCTRGLATIAKASSNSPRQRQRQSCAHWRGCSNRNSALVCGDAVMSKVQHHARRVAIAKPTASLGKSFHQLTGLPKET